MDIRDMVADSVSLCDNGHLNQQCNTYLGQHKTTVSWGSKIDVQAFKIGRAAAANMVFSSGGYKSWVKTPPEEADPEPFASA